MKAVYYDGKDAFYREDYPVPKAGEQESLVQILLSAVCNTDKEVLKGYKPDFTGVMGHEFVGKVITSSDPSLVGKRVVGELNEECGHCIYCKTGIKISFPIIADRNGQIARKYGMISNDISNTETVRNVFIIDDKGIIRTILIYPMNVGRFIPEIIRIIQALQMADCMKSSTPANWMPNQPVIMPIPKNFEELQERNNYIQENRNGINWYLSFEQPSKKCIGDKEDNSEGEEKC